MTTTRIKPAPAPAGAARRTGFTLIELLVVIGVIGLLVSIVLVAGSGALASSKRTQTERFLATVAAGLEQFKGDFGYYPPLLNPPPNAAIANPARAVVVTEAGPNAYVASTGDLERKRYYSVHSLTAYLAGVGDLNYGGKEVYDDPNTPNVREVNLDDGADGPGIRNPGPDKSWGGALMRNGGTSGEVPETGKVIPDQTGRTYGPYLDIAQGKGLRVAREETAAGGRRDETADPEHVARGMYFLTDRWDKPIRYYRHWPTKARGGTSAGKPSLNEVPLELLSPDAAAAYGEASDVNPQVDAPLLGAEFALLSAGEDGYFGERVDEGVANPSALLTAGRFRTDAQTPKDRKKVLGRMRDNVRVTP